MIDPATACLCDDELVALIDGGLPDPRRSGVIAHADRCAACRRLLVAMLPDAGAHDDELRPGDVVVGRYELCEVVGTGAMSVVYAARDPELDRRVAVKLLRRATERDDAEPSGVSARIRREAHAMAKLSHPNVVPVHDVGVFEGRVFLAMGLVEGGTLRAWLGESRSLAEVVDAFRSAGRGLAAAHDAGVLHRDFKPDNVLVGRDGRVLVTDFGLARAVDAADEPRSVATGGATGSLDVALTRTGEVVGTPGYLAPEILDGEKPSAASDQFSFCVAFFEALAGRRPFQGTTLAELRRSIEAGPAQLRTRGVPARLRRVIARGLSEQPERRFDSMHALLAELPRAVAPPKRLRVAALVAAAGGSALALAAAVWVARVRRSPSPPLAPDVRTPIVRFEKRADLPGGTDTAVLSADRRSYFAVLDDDLVQAPLDGGRPRVLATGYRGWGVSDVRSERVLLHSKKGLRLHSLDSGAVQPLTTNPVLGASFARSGGAVAALEADRLTVIGLEWPPRTIATLGVTIGCATAPAFDPSGRYVAFLEPETLRVMDTVTSEVSVVARGSYQLPGGLCYVAWPTPGWILAAEESAGPTRIVAVPVDERGRSRGAPRPTIDAPKRSLHGPGAGTVVGLETIYSAAVFGLLGQTVAFAARTAPSCDFRPSSWTANGELLGTSHCPGEVPRSVRFEISGAEMSPRPLPEVSGLWPVASSAGVLSWELTPETKTARLRVSGRSAAFFEAQVETLRASPGLQCARERCVVEGSDGAFRAHLYAFDVATGRIGEDVLGGRTCESLCWALSPDGSAIATSEPDGILIVRELRTGAERRVHVDAPGFVLQTLRWEHDGFLATGLHDESPPHFRLVRVSPTGATQLLYGTDDTWLAQPVPAPDGARLGLMEARFVGILGSLTVEE